MLVGKYFPVKIGKIPRVADSSGPGGCGIKEWMMGGDEGVPTDPQIWDGAGMEPGWPRTPSIAKFHLPLSRTKLLI